MKWQIGPLFIGYVDYGMAWAIIIRLPKWLWEFRQREADRCSQKEADRMEAKRCAQKGAERCPTLSGVK